MIKGHEKGNPDPELPGVGAINICIAQRVGLHRLHHIQRGVGFVFRPLDIYIPRGTGLKDIKFSVSQSKRSEAIGHVIQREAEQHTSYHLRSATKTASPG